MTRKLRFFFVVMLIGLIKYRQCKAGVPEFHSMSFTNQRNFLSHTRFMLKIQRFQKIFLRQLMSGLDSTKDKIIKQIIKNMIKARRTGDSISTNNRFRKPGWLYRYRK